MEEVSLLHALVKEPPQELPIPAGQREKVLVNDIINQNFNLGLSLKRVRGRKLVYQRPLYFTILK